MLPADDLRIIERGLVLPYCHPANCTTVNINKMWLLILLGLSSSVAPPVWGSAIVGGGVRPTVRATVVAVLTVLVGHGVVEVAVVASSPTLLLLLLLGLVLLAVIS